MTSVAVFDVLLQKGSTTQLPPAKLKAMRGMSPNVLISITTIVNQMCGHLSDENDALRASYQQLIDSKDAEIASLRAMINGLKPSK